ncbi:MAG: sigma-70 family RNA polymerase sigma factor [Leptolyngbyaceae bacterium]|nr:sigma-70 family RNA polymerase sigma factor [Leptolyngbyaceae bacterium]
MPPRKRLIDIFSTFIRFQSDVSVRWVSDARLQRNMKRELDNCDESHLLMTATSDSFWAQFWYLEWKQQSHTAKKRLARDHLAAYLQEPCWWVAYDFSRSLNNDVFSPADCFQLAIAEIDKVLAAYDSYRSTSLKNYAKLAYKSRLRDIFRQHKEAEISSHWTLLRRVSKHAFLEALTLSGERQEVIERYRLAWSCFKVIEQGVALRTSDEVKRQVSQLAIQLNGDESSPVNQARHSSDESSSLSESSSESDSSIDWASIVKLYCAERTRQQGHLDEDVNVSLLKDWLIRCDQWIRAYLNPPIVSLNIPVFDENKSEWQDAIADPKPASLDMLLEAEEQTRRQLQHQQIHQGLVHLIGSLKESHQQLLKAFYGEQLTQNLIAEQMGITQSSVSRQLTRARTLLLQRLIEWSVSTLHISPNPAHIESMGALLEEWLGIYYESVQSPTDIT